jgi:hypothetical protein
MMTWWQSLSGLTQAMYGAALVVSAPFLWQLVAAFMGLGHDGADDLGAHDVGAADADAHDLPAEGVADSIATVLAFKMLSVRALLTFFMLFFWGAALYLDRGVGLSRAFGLAVIWGVAGMASVGMLLHFLPRLAQTGTRDLAACVGSEGVVYLDIPAQGTGEVRVSVSGVVCYIKARGAAGAALKAGTPVTIRRRLGQTLLEVEPLSLP